MGTLLDWFTEMLNQMELTVNGWFSPAHHITNNYLEA